MLCYVQVQTFIQVNLWKHTVQKSGSFLANEKSKHQLIFQYLRDDGQVVHQGNLDADTLIVQCALQFAIEGSKVCCS